MPDCLDWLMSGHSMLPRPPCCLIATWPTRGGWTVLKILRATDRSLDTPHYANDFQKQLKPPLWNLFRVSRDGGYSFTFRTDYETGSKPFSKSFVFLYSRFELFLILHTAFCCNRDRVWEEIGNCTEKNVKMKCIGARTKCEIFWDYLHFILFS